MFSLQSILTTHQSVLLLDAASSAVHAGWITRDHKSRWVKIAAEASSGVFRAIRELRVSPNDASAFVFCEGPGSILGIRTVATALRTWTALTPRPVYAYRSLELTAKSVGQPGQTIICDARRQSWHAVQLSPDHEFGPLTRIPTADLPSSALVTPVEFRQWSISPSPKPASVPYDPARLASDLIETPLLRESPEPDAFLHEDPAYARWTPAVHRAPPRSS